MTYETISDYINYISNAVTYSLNANTKSILLTSTIVGFIYSFINSISTVLAIHGLFLVIYFILAISDTVTGIASSMYVEKQKFNSAKFIKKGLLVGFCLFIMLVVEMFIIVFSEYSYTKSSVLEALLTLLVFCFQVAKIMLMLAFIIYELTSLRENFIRLRLTQFVWAVDLLIMPLNKLNKYLDSKYDSTLNNK